MIKVTQDPKLTYSMRTIEYELEINGNTLELFESSDDNGSEIQYYYNNTWNIYPPEWLNSVDFDQEYEDFEDWFSDNLHLFKQNKIFNNN